MELNDSIGRAVTGLIEEIKKSDEYIKQMKKEAIVEAFESQYVAAFSNSVQMNDKYNNALSDFEAFKEGLSQEQLEILENQDEFEKEFIQLDAKLMTGSFTTDDELEDIKLYLTLFVIIKTIIMIMQPHMKQLRMP